jgi:gamma-glutamylcyclotransferase (GGCT)/AIG2-like uncharacterized protein YtfP
MTEFNAEHRLATYGTLAPGRVNHHEVAGIRGTWRQGTVRGRLYPDGWGAALGYPGLVLDPRGDVVHVFVLESLDLPQHWQRLDTFEGEGYRRVVTCVQTDDVETSASIYVLATDPDLTA